MLFASDLHFGSNRSEDIAAFLAAARDEAAGDRLVIVPGDLTMTGTTAEYEAATAFVSALVDMGLHVVLTPGNHDFGKWQGERLGRRQATRARFAELLKLIHAQAEVVAAVDFDAIHVIGADVFVALRSTHRGQLSSARLLGTGRIRGEQIDWALAELTRLRVDGTGHRRHLVTHRSLWQDEGDEPDKHEPMKRRGRLERELLVPLAFRTVIHGHNHRAVVAQVALPKGGRTITRIGVPTLSTRDHGPGQARGWLAGALASEELPRFVPAPPT